MSKAHRIHTSDHRTAPVLWISAGGSIEAIRRTGEIRYRHPTFTHSLKVNGRRSDTPAVVMCYLNKLARDGRIQF
jgi:hypothetical protein